MSVFYTMEEFETDCQTLAGLLTKDSYSSIYGVPRGGVPLAIRLSSLTGIPLTSVPKTKTLIVDDICDSGATRERFPNNDFVCIHASFNNALPGGGKQKQPTLFLHNASEYIDYWWEQSPGAGSLTDNITRILQFVGEDVARPGLLETPQRVERMYKEFFQGYDPARRPKMTKVPNGQDGVQYDEMLQDEGYFFSYCEHHIVPFFGNYYFGYIPDKHILGASKIARLIDWHAGKLQIAERLVNDIVADLQAELEPKGLILVMRARHLCKEMRGIKKYDSPYEARAVRGYFAENRNGCKDEFMARIPVR